MRVDTNNKRTHRGLSERKKERNIHLRLYYYYQKKPQQQQQRIDALTVNNTKNKTTTREREFVTGGVASYQKKTNKTEER